MKIFLVGMPGSGKSTIGQQLASSLEMDFVDLDAAIQEAEGSSIDEIFKTKGEEHFRLIESQMLRLWIGSDQSFVLSTGGGTPCFYNGIEVINNAGLSIFLDERVSVLIERLKNNMDRPLLKTTDLGEMRAKLEKIRADRLSCYEKASITVRAATLSKIMKAIKLRS
ncbi:MAG: shikimate kinase [Chryseolinea sp.]